MPKLTDEQRFQQRQQASYARFVKQQGFSNPPPIIGIETKVRPRHITQDDFIRLYNQSKSLRDLGKLLNDMGVPSVRRLCIKFGLPTKIFRPQGLRPYHEITREELKTAYKNSYSIPQLAEQLNCSPNTARNLCKANYLPTDMKSVDRTKL